MTPTRSLTRRRACPVELPHETFVILDGQRIEPGQPIQIDGLRGEYVFRYRYLRDGSITVYGGEGQHRQFRAIRPDRCHPPKKRRKRWQMTEEQRAAAAERLAKARAVRATMIQQGRN